MNITFDPHAPQDRQLVQAILGLLEPESGRKRRFAHRGPSRHRRLTLAQARSIIARDKQGERREDLAAEYGLSISAISSLVNGRTYRDA